MRLYQGSKFRSVPVETAGIFRSIPKTGTEHVMKNSGLCTGLFRSESSKLPESDRYMYYSWNRGTEELMLVVDLLF